MKYFILLLCVTSLCFAQGINQKPPFQWEKVFTEGRLSSGMFRVVKSFSDNTIFVIGDQVRDNSFTKRFFQGYNVANGEELWTTQDSADGFFLNTSINANTINTFENFENEIEIGYIVPLNNPELPNYRYLRKVSIDNFGKTTIKSGNSPGVQTHRLLQLWPVGSNEYLFTSYLKELNSQGLEAKLVGFKSSSNQKTFEIPFFHYLHPDNWKTPALWKNSENEIAYFIGLNTNDTNLIEFRTINPNNGEHTKVQITTELLGFPDVNISIKESIKIQDYYYVYAIFHTDFAINVERVLMKIDKKGKLVDFQLVPNNFECWGLEHGPNNSMFLHGYTHNIEEEPYSGYNQWLARFDENLTKTHEYIWGTNSRDVLTACHYINGVGLVTAGYYNNNNGTTSNFISHANIGLIPESVFLDASSVQENKSETLTLKIVEDASSNSSLVVNSKHRQTVTIKLLDANGRLVYVVSTGILSEGENRFTLPISLSYGMYLVSCEQNGTILGSEKFILKK